MLTEDEVKKLKEEHGPALVSVFAAGVDLVFKKPSRVVWTDFVDAITKERSSKDVALRRLALACVVQPTTAETTAIFDALPALPAKVAGELSDLAGASDEFDVKKL